MPVTRLPTALAPVEFMGSSKIDLSAFPEEVKDVVGQALYEAQVGDKPRIAKPLTGFKGAGVLEIVDSHDGNAYRAVYTVKFANVVYVLHAFQKKSKSGIATPQADINRVITRFKAAEKHYNETYAPKRAG